MLHSGRPRITFCLEERLDGEVWKKWEISGEKALRGENGCGIMEGQRFACLVVVLSGAVFVRQRRAARYS